MKAFVVSLYTISAPPAVERGTEIAKGTPFCNLKRGNFYF